MVLPTRDNYIQPACPLPERMLTEFELLRQELKIERRKNLDQGSSYQAELGQYKYFLKIQENKVKDFKERTRIAARRLQGTRFEEQETRR